MVANGETRNEQTTAARWLPIVAVALLVVVATIVAVTVLASVYGMNVG